MLIGKTISYQSMFHVYFCEIMTVICKNVVKCNLDITQITQLINDSHFVESMNEKDGKTWMAFILIARTF
jgi:hypothetical protein